MATGALTSDHVNYLIWRYLQESGYGDAAVKLQRDWVLDPQTLPFAQHIKTHALVSLVQKGLQYHGIEQSFSKSGRSSSSSPAALFFGVETARATSPSQHEQNQDAPSYTARSSPRARKHGRESNTNGLSLELPTTAPAPKRSRRSNGTETSPNGESMQIDQNGYHTSQHGPPEPVSPTDYSPVEDVDAPTANGMEMDDDEADAPATPSPEDPHLTLTLTNGHSIGIQSDKVDELEPKTIILTVPDKKLIMHTAWNPHDPTILATAGEGLCRIWSISKTAALADSPTSSSYQDILTTYDESLVTTMAWNPNGEVLAVATRNDASDWAGAVSLCGKEGQTFEDLPAAQDIILMLRWNPSGTRLLGITSSGTGSNSVTIWDIRSSEAPVPCQVDHIVTDGAWISETQFTVCGHGIIATADLSTIESTPLSQQLTNGKSDEIWTHIRHDPITRSTAFAAEDTATLLLLGPADGPFTRTAHAAEITALAFQPMANPATYSSASPRLLATSSLDTTTKIWDARNLALLHTFSLGQSSPAMAISFTPDGYLVASANWNRILIWNAEVGGLPKASWKGELGKRLLTNGNGHMDHDSAIGDDGDENGIGEGGCSLSWDAEGGKLALGVGSQIAIINFRP